MAAKILVVDDDPAISEMLTMVLQGEGFSTVTVGDGAGYDVVTKVRIPQQIESGIWYVTPWTDAYDAVLEDTHQDYSGREA